MADHSEIDLGLGRRGLIVPAHAVARVIDLDDARDLVRRLMESPDGAFQVRTLAEGAELGFVDDTRAIEIVAAMIARRDLLLVRLQSPSFFRPPPSTPRGERDADVTRLSDLLPRDATDPDTRWIELLIFGAQGLRLTGTELRLRLPDGGRRSHRLDASGRVRFDHLVGDGAVDLELVTPVAWDVPRESQALVNPDVVPRIAWRRVCSRGCGDERRRARRGRARDRSAAGQRVSGHLSCRSLPRAREGGSAVVDHICVRRRIDRVGGLLLHPGLAARAPVSVHRGRSAAQAVHSSWDHRFTWVTAASVRWNTSSEPVS